MGLFRNFPYSNFHEMNTDDLIKIVKDMLEQWAKYYGVWDDWKNQVTTEWLEMQSFIHNYFDNLDVQTEINNKIVSMVNSGEFANIVDPYIPPAVSDWLSAHITTPETVVIDDTLTIQGAAADAKATGDAITDLKQELLYLDENPRTFNLVLTSGKYVNKSGVIITNGNTALAISDYIRIPDSTYRIKGTKFGANISSLMDAMNFYDANKQWLGGLDYWESGDFSSDEIPDGAVYVILGNYYPLSPPVHNQCNVTFYVFNINETVSQMHKDITDISLNRNGIVDDVFVDKTAIKNTNINYTTGEPQTNANFLATGFIEIEAETTYHVMRDNNLVNSAGNVAFYDERREYGYISGQGSNWTDWTTPANAKYVRFSVYMSPWTQDTFSFANVQIVKGSVAKVINNIVLLDKGKYSPLSGKKWIGIGDSLTEVNARADLRYWNYIANPNNMTFVNMGVGGTGYINRQNENKAFYQRAIGMDSDADVITVFGGVNDCLFAAADMGEPTDTGTTTWCGCVNALIDNIRSIYLFAPLGIISPLPCDWIDENNESQYDTQLPNDPNCRMTQFVEKLNTICALRGIPFLDLFHQSNMLPDDDDFKAVYYSSGTTRTGDGLHPNSKGHKLFYRKIEKFVETLLAE